MQLSAAGPREATPNHPTLSEAEVAGVTTPAMAVQVLRNPQAAFINRSRARHNTMHREIL